MPPAGFEPVIPAGDRPQTHALDRSATGIGHSISQHTEFCCRRKYFMQGFKHKSALIFHESMVKKIFL
jgi:hypothetical protein